MTTTSNPNSPHYANIPRSLPLAVARRQKRVKYWEARLAGGENTESSSEIEEQLNTYRLLISKLVRAKTDQEKQETEERLSALERELTSRFEARRLMTSEIGIPAVGDK